MAQETIRIKVSLVPPTGHKEHISGTGAHQDKRKKRKRTRNAEKREAIKYSKEG